MNNKEYEPIIEILDEIFGDHGSHNEGTGQLTYCCPTCSYDIKGLDRIDNKYNLEINYKLKVGKCWVCSETHGTRGSIEKLIKRYGTKRQLKKYHILYPENENETFEKKYEEVKLPKEFISFSEVSNGMKLTHLYRQAYNYVKRRRITDEMLKKYNIGFCYEGKYAYRIIIPSYDKNGDLNYFIARSYEQNPFKKYLNPEVKKEIIIFNESLIDWSKPIYLVEGAFDSIFLENSIPMLGKVLSEQLFNLLYQKAVEVIIVLDPDAYENEKNIYYTLNGGRLMGKIYVTHLEGDKDIADLCGNLEDYPPFQLD